MSSHNNSVLDVSNIFHSNSPHQGTFRISKSLFGWRNGKTGEIIQNSFNNLTEVRYSLINQTQYEITFILNNENSLTYYPFTENEIKQIKSFLEKSCSISLHAGEKYACRGWHWGTYRVNNTHFCLDVEEKTAFDISNEIINDIFFEDNSISLILNKNENINVQDGCEVSNITISVPTSNSNSQDAFELSNLLKSKYQLNKNKETSIIYSINYLNFFSPHGRFDFIIFPTAFHLKGYSNHFKINYTSIKKTFLIYHKLCYILIFLNSPIKRGNTSYTYILFSLSNLEPMDLTLHNVENEVTKKFLKDHGSKNNEKNTATTPEKSSTDDNPMTNEPTIEQELSETATVHTRECDLIINLLVSFANHPIVTSDPFLKTQRFEPISCSYKINTGVLCLLDSELIFLPKPVVTISLSAITKVAIHETKGSETHFFHIELESKHNIIYKFSTMPKTQMTDLINYLSANNVTYNVENQSSSVGKVSAQLDDDSDENDHTFDEQDESDSDDSSFSESESDADE